MSSLITQFNKNLLEDEDIKNTLNQISQAEKVSSDLTKMFANAIGALSIIRTDELPFFPFEEGQFFGNLMNIKNREQYSGEVIESCKNNFDLDKALEKVFKITKDFSNIASDKYSPWPSREDIINHGQKFSDSLIATAHSAKNPILHMFNNGDVSFAIKTALEHELDGSKDYRKDFAFNLFNNLQFGESKSVYDYYEQLFRQKYIDEYKEKQIALEQHQMQPHTDDLPIIC